MGCVYLHALAQWKSTCVAVSHCIFLFLLGFFLCLRETEFSDSALGSAQWTRAEESALRTRSEERHAGAREIF